MERLNFDTSQSDFVQDFFLKKKFRKLKLALWLMFALIISVAVINIVNNEMNRSSSRTDYNAIEEVIKTLTKNYNDISFTISNNNHHASEMEKRTNERNDKILERINGMASNISEIDRLANKMENRTTKSNVEIIGRISGMALNASETNRRVNEMEKRTNRSNAEIHGRINEISVSILELRFKLEKKNLVYKLEQNESCLDTINGTSNCSLVLFPCHDYGHNQEWQFTVDEELKNRNSCLTFTNNTSSNGSQVMFEECNGSASQKLKFVSGALQSTEYDVCVQTEGNVTFAAKCNSSMSTQKFERKLLYEIDQVCTFKQGSYVLLDAYDVSVASNGFLVFNAKCLDSTLSWVLCATDVESHKWKYADDGQLQNTLADACLEKYDNGTVALNKCDYSSESQKWNCDEG